MRQGQAGGQPADSIKINWRYRKYLATNCTLWLQGKNAINPYIKFDFKTLTGPSPGMSVDIVNINYKLFHETN